MTLDGKVLAWLGRKRHRPKQFGWIHEVARPGENTLFAGELLNWRVRNSRCARLFQSTKRLGCD